MNSPAYNRSLIVITLLAACTVPACAETAPEIFSDWQEPASLNNLEEFMGAVRITAPGPDLQATVVYRYPNGATGRIDCTWARDSGIAKFSVPAEASAGLGMFTYSVEVAVRETQVVSAPRQIPMAYAEELDITGPAAVVLPYPLPGEDYLVRYVPCCNIYGGITYAERTPVNPTGATKGLPERLVSDFVVLEPDPLSASTMGLYFVFTSDPADLVDEDEANITLYEFNGRDAWTPALTVERDPDANTLQVHCPDGGVFVLGIGE